MAGGRRGGRDLAVRLSRIPRAPPSRDDFDAVKPCLVANERPPVTRGNGREWSGVRADAAGRRRALSGAGGRLGRFVMAAVASSGGLTSLWFLTRGTGVVSLVLLTLVVPVGVANVRRVQLEGVPRFVVEAIHRNAALLAVAFLCVHIVMAVLDPFAPIKLADAVIPFISAYRPIWLGLGAVAFDLLIAVVLTSIWRRRVGFGAWRWIHWAAYLCWPIAIVHGLGSGTDAKTKWMLLLSAGCMIIVVLAAFARALSGWPDHLTPLLTGMLASAAVPIGLLVWLPNGPLAQGWAKRAGTPAIVVATGAATAPAGASSKGGGSLPSAGASAPGSFQVPVQGSVRRAAGDEGNASIHMVLSAGAGQALSQLHILIEGRPLHGGGVQMTGSSVAGSTVVTTPSPTALVATHRSWRSTAAGPTAGSPTPTTRYGADRPVDRSDHSPRRLVGSPVLRGQ